jgi:hypothetical protein
VRVQFTFPPQYPHSTAKEDGPVIDLETSVAVSKATRAMMIAKLQDIRQNERPCLSACIAYLLGYQERRGRLGLRQEESDSEEDDDDRLPFQQPMMPKKACGASFGPNGALIPLRGDAVLGLTLV